MKNEIAVPLYFKKINGEMKPDITRIINEFTTQIENEMEIRGELTDEAKEKLRAYSEKIKTLNPNTNEHL